MSTRKLTAVAVAASVLALATGAPAQARLALNALTINGLQVNGLQLNGPGPAGAVRTGGGGVGFDFNAVKLRGVTPPPDDGRAAREEPRSKDGAVRPADASVR